MFNREEVHNNDSFDLEGISGTSPPPTTKNNHHIDDHSNGSFEIVEIPEEHETSRSVLSKIKKKNDEEKAAFAAAATIASATSFEKTKSAVPRSIEGGNHPVTRTTLKNLGFAEVAKEAAAVAAIKAAFDPVVVAPAAAMAADQSHHLKELTLEVDPDKFLDFDEDWCSKKKQGKKEATTTSTTTTSTTQAAVLSTKNTEEGISASAATNQVARRATAFGRPQFILFGDLDDPNPSYLVIERKRNWAPENWQDIVKRYCIKCIAAHYTRLTAMKVTSSFNLRFKEAARRATASGQPQCIAIGDVQDFIERTPVIRIYYIPAGNARPAAMNVSSENFDFLIEGAVRRAATSGQPKPSTLCDCLRIMEWTKNEMRDLYIRVVKNFFRGGYAQIGAMVDTSGWSKNSDFLFDKAAMKATNLEPPQPLSLRAFQDVMEWTHNEMQGFVDWVVLGIYRAGYARVAAMKITSGGRPQLLPQDNDDDDDDFEKLSWTLDESPTTKAIGMDRGEEAAVTLASAVAKTEATVSKSTSKSFPQAAPVSRDATAGDRETFRRDPPPEYYYESNVPNCCEDYKEPQGSVGSRAVNGVTSFEYTNATDNDFPAPHAKDSVIAKENAELELLVANEKLKSELWFHEYWNENKQMKLIRQTCLELESLVLNAKMKMELEKIEKNRLLANALYQSNLKQIENERAMSNAKHEAKLKNIAVTEQENQDSGCDDDVILTQKIENANVTTASLEADFYPFKELSQSWKRNQQELHERPIAKLEAESTARIARTDAEPEKIKAKAKAMEALSLQTQSRRRMRLERKDYAIPRQKIENANETAESLEANLMSLGAIINQMSTRRTDAVAEKIKSQAAAKKVMRKEASSSLTQLRMSM